MQFLANVCISILLDFDLHYGIVFPCDNDGAASSPVENSTLFGLARLYLGTLDTAIAPLAMSPFGKRLSLALSTFVLYLPRSSAL